MTNYRWFLLFIFIATVIWSAINPQSRIDWFLEALPVLIAAPVIILIARHFKLSDISYTLITIYMVLPLISSHYSVVGVSFGQWIGSLLHTTRNMYDLVTHFAFGVLWFYPIRESLGGALLRAGSADQAEIVFREGLRLRPRNGRMLFGLMKSLEAQQKMDAAVMVQMEFDWAWKNATVPLRVESL